MGSPPNMPIADDVLGKLSFAVSIDPPEEICRLGPDGKLTFAEGWDAERVLILLMKQAR